MLIAAKSTTGWGLECSWAGFWSASSWYSAGGTGPKSQSARPCSIAVTASWVLGTVRHTIEAGFPAGWAAWDHSRKNGLRSKRISVAVTETILYGPVPGTVCEPVSWSGVPGGIGAEYAKSVSLNRNSGSGAMRWTVTVPEASLVTMPCARSQRRGRRTHALAPTMQLNSDAPWGADAEQALDRATEIVCE